MTKDKADEMVHGQGWAFHNTVGWEAIWEVRGSIEPR